MADKIVLYTNHRCPWAHRAHIALAELGVPFEEVIIDLDRPRDPEYLQINPRGLVPSLQFNGEIITESAIVAGFLADTYPDKAPLVPVSSSKGGALARARIAFFVDAYFSKLQSQIFKLGAAKTDAEEAAVGEAVVAAALKELEPLLAGSTSPNKPFFGGSERLTLAEVLTGSFVVRLVALTKSGVWPSNIPALAAKQTPAFWAWAQAVAAHPSVTGIFNEDVITASTKARLAKQRAAA
ncbi:hypothetical protein SCUCBS95973_007882 [Sporothrix curviconia]|uniref:Glutathione S-transferase n=1 Tax=Sporothrix curviconia TaxID=1260050 RepID=A0ABP0CH27_9PEZI